uniref:Craniofacial development protein 2 n=1 Tax=Cacopsylla melanoneura TaxID=428564 RepID=A0A8D8WJF1_9HEMI
MVSSELSVSNAVTATMVMVLRWVWFLGPFLINCLFVLVIFYNLPSYLLINKNMSRNLRPRPRVLRGSIPLHQDSGEETERARGATSNLAVTARLSHGKTPSENPKQTTPTDIRKNQYKIGTWNVKGMNQLGKTENIVNEMYIMDIDILGISETFLKNSGDYVSRLPNDRKYRMISTGGEKSRKGVAFVLNEKTMNMVDTVVQFSERVMALRIKAHPVDLFIVQCYAPTADSSDEDLDNFYECLRKVIGKKKSYEALVVLGDMNAKVGSERIGDIVGPHGLGSRNERGEEFINFCNENNLIITNTWFEQKKSSRFTWTSPANNQIKNKIDYICINRRYKNAIINSKSRPGADCGSDHIPVVATLQLKLKRVIKKPRKVTWDLQKCKNMSTKEQFSAIFMCEVDKGKNEEYNINNSWNEQKNALMKAAEKEIGQSQSLAKEKWMTQAILDEMEVRKELKMKSMLGEEHMKRYKEARKNIQLMCRNAKEVYMNKECEEAEILERVNTNKFHTKIKSLMKKDNKVSEYILGVNGEELYEGEEQILRWKQYCEQLYKDSNRPQLEPRVIDDNEIPKFTEEDIRRILKSLSNNKAVGTDQIPIEFVKTLNERAMSEITLLINSIYKEGIIPSDFLESIFIPLPKKNKAKNCTDFRTISLISHSSKILLSIIRERITKRIEQNLAETQMGFRAGKGCRDGITALRVLLERSVEMRVDVFLAFVDFEKAFDNLKHENLRDIIEEIDIPKAELRLIENLYWNQRGKVRTKFGDSESFNIEKGVRQGCLISPILFNIYVEKIIDKALGMEEKGFSINGRIVNNLRYADDTLIIAKSKGELKRLLEQLNNACAQYGMRINMKKTKTMTVRKIEKQEEEPNIILGSETLEEVKKYPYLGAEITHDARCVQEVRKRIGIAKNSFWKHEEILRRNVNLPTKLRILNTYIFSTFTYACESWTIDKYIAKRITGFENWCYRRILRIKWIDKVRNVEVLRRIGKRSFDLLTRIKKRKMAYAGHIMRGSSGELLLNIVEGRIVGSRDRGRQRRKWSDDIKDWTKIRNYGECKRMAERREDWRKIIENIT